MKTLVLALALSAQPGDAVVGDRETVEIYVITSPSTVAKIFQMDPGSCLRGPLTFYNSDGSTIYHLAANHYDPPDCFMGVPVHHRPRLKGPRHE